MTFISEKRTASSEVWILYPRISSPVPCHWAIVATDKWEKTYFAHGFVHWPKKSCGAMLNDSNYWIDISSIDHLLTLSQKLQDSINLLCTWFCTWAHKKLWSYAKWLKLLDWHFKCRSFAYIESKTSRFNHFTLHVVLYAGP